MNYRNIMTGLALFPLAVIVTCFMMLSACGNGKDVTGDAASNAGSLTFNIVFQNSFGKPPSLETVIDCAGQSVATVEAKVYDPYNVHLIDGGPWPCNAGQGSIASVPPGSGRKIVIVGKNADGQILFRGEKPGVNVVANSENNAGTINCTTFVSTLLAPADGATSADGVTLQWEDIAGTSGYTYNYIVTISENSDLSNPFVEHTATATNYTPSGLANGQTYFWQVFALDSFDNRGIDSDIWSFAITEDTAPVAKIDSPDDNSTYTADDVIEFVGSGSDNEDVELSGASLVWSSDLDGQIGTGETVNSRTLVAGTHLITLTVTDSGGATGMDSVVITIPPGKIPDTGQNHIDGYTKTPGEDMDYDINPPAYTKLDASGNILDVGATDWAMARDDVTGLIWEVKTDDGSIHDKDKTYTWQDAHDAKDPQRGFIAMLNDEKFGGYADWRLPSVKELYSLVHNRKVDTGHPTPKISLENFRNTMRSAYWSSTTYARNQDEAWSVFFDDSRLGFRSKSTKFYVRAVRGGHSSENLEDNDDDTVSDNATGLMWQKFAVQKVDWNDALTHCEQLNLAGHDDWRLPNAKELQSIVDYEKSGPPFINAIFENAVTSAYWSSTTYAESTGYAWRVHLNYGDFYYFDKLNPPHPFYVRAVRGGER